MANYNTLQEAIDAGITNMYETYSGDTNYGDPYSMNINWFKFNEKVASYVYIHGGRSYISFSNNDYDFGTNICINYYGSNWYNHNTKRYTESGTINGVNFYKIRWVGYGNSGTLSSYQLEYEIFLFEYNNQIFLRYIKKPSNMLDRINQFVCGNQVIDLTNEVSSYSEWTFVPNDVANGKDWVKKTGVRPILVPLDGEAEYSMTFTSQDKEAILWEETTPTNTSIDVYIKYMPGAEYKKISSGTLLDKTRAGASYTLYIKIKLHADDTALTSPTISNLHLLSGEDRKKIYLNMANTISTVNPVSVAYDGLGGLQGFGGAVAAFSEQIV